MKGTSPGASSAKSKNANDTWQETEFDVIWRMVNTRGGCLCEKMQDEKIFQCKEWYRWFLNYKYICEFWISDWIRRKTCVLDETIIWGKIKVLVCAQCLYLDDQSILQCYKPVLETWTEKYQHRTLTRQSKNITCQFIRYEVTNRADNSNPQVAKFSRKWANIYQISFGFPPTQ